MGGIVTIDRSGLVPPTEANEIPPPPDSDTPLSKHVASLIRFRGGPLTLAEFMQEALTHPQHGYYSRGNVFGSRGDFVTSPEVSQMMGELLGIWTFCVWRQVGSPAEFRLVEVGPGRGTLMADLLRATSTFREFSSALRVHLVEVSSPMRRLQWAMLRCQTLGEHFGSDAGPNSNSEDVGISFVSGARIHWHKDVSEVPGGPVAILAHELLDALPTHQFVRTERGWREVLVDLWDPTLEGNGSNALRMVLAPEETPASRLLLPRRLQALGPGTASQLQSIEISAKAMGFAQQIAHRIEESDGAALLIDYGKDGPYESSIKAIRGHKFVDTLHAPGKTDLSVDVDFSALRMAIKEIASGKNSDAYMHGPITQSQLLHSLGVTTRLESLLQQASKEQGENLISGYRRLVGSTEEGGMGESYLAVAITRKESPPPVGFEQLPRQDS